jgi:hypothetical protein
LLRPICHFPNLLYSEPQSPTLGALSAFLSKHPFKKKFVPQLIFLRWQGIFETKWNFKAGISDLNLEVYWDFTHKGPAWYLVPFLQSTWKVTW